VRLLYLLLFTTSIYANPIAYNLPFFKPLIHFSLLSESIVIAMQLKDFGFYFFRILFIWYFVTIFTYSIFFTSLLLLMEGKHFEYYIAITIITILELIVIYIESKIIKRFSKISFFRKDDITISNKEAFKISLIGNLISIYAGVIFDFFSHSEIYR